MSQRFGPPIPVLVELSSEFAFAADASNPVTKDFGPRIKQGLDLILYQCGIPGETKVEVQVSVEAPFSQLVVHGATISYPLEFVQRQYAYFSDLGLAVNQLSLSWEKDLKQSLTEDKLIDFIERLLIESASRSPQLLLADEQTAAFIRTEITTPLNADKLPQVTSVLRRLLTLGIALTNTSAIVPRVLRGVSDDEVETDIAEALVSTLRAKAIEVSVNLGYAEKLLDRALQEGESFSAFDSQIVGALSEQFKQLTEAVFYDLGVWIPDIVLVASSKVNHNSFTIKFNQTFSIECRGLQSDQLFVNRTTGELKLLTATTTPVAASAGSVSSLVHRLRRDEAEAPAAPFRIQPFTLLNPSNDTEGSVINDSDREFVAAHNSYVWDPMAYLLLVLGRELRRNAWRLIHTENVEYDLARFHEVFPALVLAATEKLSLERLTAILRQLVKEDISIRDLRAILELTLTFDYIVTDPEHWIVFDERLALSHEPKSDGSEDARNCIQYVRAGLKRYLTSKLTRGRTTLIVFLIDPEIEKMIGGHLAHQRGNDQKTALTTDDTNRILRAVRNEVHAVADSSNMPVVLTIAEIRYYLREIIAPEFPSLPVVSYDELSPDANIQPIARISLN